MWLEWGIYGRWELWCLFSSLEKRALFHLWRLQQFTRIYRANFVSLHNFAHWAVHSNSGLLERRRRRQGSQDPSDSPHWEMEDLCINWGCAKIPSGQPRAWILNPSVILARCQVGSLIPDKDPTVHQPRNAAFNQLSLHNGCRSIETQTRSARSSTGESACKGQSPRHYRRLRKRFVTGNAIISPGRQLWPPPIFFLSAFISFCFFSLTCDASNLWAQFVTTACCDATKRQKFSDRKPDWQEF